MTSRIFGQRTGAYVQSTKYGPNKGLQEIISKRWSQSPVKLLRWGCLRKIVTGLSTRIFSAESRVSDVWMGSDFSCVFWYLKKHYVYVIMQTLVKIFAFFVYIFFSFFRGLQEFSIDFLFEFRFMFWITLV